MFDHEIAELIQRHMNELGNNITIEKILANPRYKRVWAYWQALAYFKMKEHYPSLEEAPEGIKWITIMDETCRNYAWRDGSYVLIQTITKEFCKSVYGEE